MRAVGPEPTTDELIARAQRNDTAAFDALFVRYAGRIRAFAAVRRVRDADAVANDVMLQVFRHLGDFTGSASGFEGWLFTIARNRIIDDHRAAARRPHDLTDAPPETPSPSAEGVALAALDAQAALDLLDVLTDDQREVVGLRMIADLSIAQVAEIVGKPESAVKALQRRGLARLQREILTNPYPD